MTIRKRIAYADPRPRHVAIVGSRHITDYRRFALTIRPQLNPSDVIVSGGADGIDTLAARYARQNGHTLVEHPVDLQAVRRREAEGMDRIAAFAAEANLRNQLIVDQSDRMIAIACDHSKGTYDSLRRMRRKVDPRMGGNLLWVVEYLWDCPRA